MAKAINARCANVILMTDTGLPFFVAISGSGNAVFIVEL
jgi:hypothetical protein